MNVSKSTYLSKLFCQHYIKSSQNILIQAVHIHIKYIDKTEAQWALFV